ASITAYASGGLRALTGNLAPMPGALLLESTRLTALAMWREENAVMQQRLRADDTATQTNRELMIGSLIALYAVLAAAIALLVRSMQRVYRHAEEAEDHANTMQERESQLSNIIANAVDGIIIIDEAGTIEAFNPASEKLFGYRAAEAIGQNVSLLMPEPYRG